MITREWTHEHLYFDGDTYFNDVLAAIANAQISIDLETYIYDTDSVGLRFETALMEAAKRGVHVRVLVDGIGGGAWADRQGKLVEAAGVELRVYHPVAFSSVFRRLLIELRPGVRESERKSAIFSRLNRRDHRKMVLIDETFAYVGSLNISSVHSKEAKGQDAWRDTAIRVEGVELTDLKTGFDYAWIRSHTIEGKRRWRDALFPLPGGLKLQKRKRSRLVRSNYTLRLRRRSHKEFALRMAGATKRIWVTNAYLAPSKPTVRRLAKAAKRGVDVRILVPRKSDVFFMPWVATAHYPPLLKAGVRIFEYLPRFLHAKSVIIDDWAAVGTSNLNRRSLLKDFEVDVVLSQSRSLEILSEQYELDLLESAEVRGPFKNSLTTYLGRFIIWLMKELI